MKKQLMVVAMTLISLTAFAQSTKEKRVALENNLDNYNRISLSFTSFSASKDGLLGDEAMRLPGFKFGWTGGYSVGKKLPFFVEAGAEIQYNTRRGDFAWNNDELRASTLGFVVPVNFGYKLGFKNGAYIEPYCGLHLKMNLAGKYKIIRDSESTEKDVSASWWNEKEMKENINVDNSKGFNRFQLGWQVGLNVGYKRVNFNLAYMPESIRLWGKTTVYMDGEAPIAIFDESRDVKSGTIVMGFGLNF